MTCSHKFLLLLVVLFEPICPFFESFSNGPGGFRQKKLQNLDSIQLQGGPKGHSTFRSAKVKVSILDYAKVAKKVLVKRALLDLDKNSF